MTERLEKQGGGEVPKPLSGKEVAALLEQSDNQVPEQLRKTLRESNIVLTIAGMKPFTFTGVDLKEDDNEKEALEVVQRGIKTLNAISVERDLGLLWWGSDTVKRKPKSLKPYIEMQLSNLAGYERVSKMSKLPGVAMYERNHGEKGLREWTRKTTVGLEEAQRHKLLPEGRDALDIMLQGLEFGYPDRAILDFVQWYTSSVDWKKRRPELSDDTMEFTEIYGGPEPYFEYAVEHREDATIQSYRREAEKILKEFYESPWHKRISDRPTALAE